MSTSKLTYELSSNKPAHAVKEEQIEFGFIGKLQDLKYEYRSDIRDRAALELNFRQKFDALSAVEVDLQEVHQQLVNIEKDVAAAKQKHNSFLRELGLPLLP